MSFFSPHTLFPPGRGRASFCTPRPGSFGMKLLFQHILTLLILLPVSWLLISQFFIYFRLKISQPFVSHCPLFHTLFSWLNDYKCPYLMFWEIKILNFVSWQDFAVWPSDLRLAVLLTLCEVTILPHSSCDSSSVHCFFTLCDFGDSLRFCVLWVIPVSVCESIFLWGGFGLVPLIGWVSLNWLCVCLCAGEAWLYGRTCILKSRCAAGWRTENGFIEVRGPLC